MLLFESDDWGLRRFPCRALLERLGPVGEWADEESESAEDLSALLAILDGVRDATGRPACWTANFIVANPDPAAIEASGFSRWVDVGIARDRQLMSIWRQGLKRRLVAPEYHGRSHIWPGHWLEALRADEPGARELLAHGVPGLGFLEDHPGYRSEYVDWRTGEELAGEALDDWLAVGLGQFEAAFGVRPSSTIAPNYAFGPAALEAWARAGLRYVQAAGYQILVDPAGGQRVVSTPAGERHGGLTMLNRNVKLEPVRGRAQWSAEAALSRIRRLWQFGLPAVVDTHRFNYTGARGREGRERLGWLLGQLEPHRPLFLTTAELGEAISGNGAFRDRFSGELRHLTVRAGDRRRSALRALAGNGSRPKRKERLP